MSFYLADKSFIALKPQVDANTPILPTIHLPLVSESVKVDPKIEADRRMKGLTFKADAMLRGAVAVSGDIVLLGDPDTMGHVLNMMLAKGVTSGSAGDGYTHPFTVGEGKSYTLDIARGAYAQRLYGVRGDKLNLVWADNRLQAKLTIKALGQYFAGTLAVALTGAGMTTYELKTDYVANPTKGLCVGDHVEIAGSDVLVSAVDANGHTFSSLATAVTASVGEPVYLKAQTPSFGTLTNPFKLHDTLAGIAATSADADTAAASEATQTPVEGLEIDLGNNLYDAKSRTGLGVLLNQVREAQIKFKQMFSTPVQHQKWMNLIKQAMTVISTGQTIKSDLTTSEKLTIKFHKIGATESANPLNVGGYIFDEQTFEALYDGVDAKDIEISLVNRTAGTVY